MGERGGALSVRNHSTGDGVVGPQVEARHPGEQEAPRRGHSRARRAGEGNNGVAQQGTAGLIQLADPALPHGRGGGQPRGVGGEGAVKDPMNAELKLQKHLQR